MSTDKSTGDDICKEEENKWLKKAGAGANAPKEDGGGCLQNGQNKKLVYVCTTTEEQTRGIMQSEKSLKSSDIGHCSHSFHCGDLHHQQSCRFSCISFLSFIDLVHGLKVGEVAHVIL